MTNFNLILQGALKQELHHRINSILIQESHIFVPCVTFLWNRIVSQEGGLPFGQGQISREGGSCEPSAANIHSSYLLRTPFKEDLSESATTSTTVHPSHCSDPLDTNIKFTLSRHASPRFRWLTNSGRITKSSLINQTTIRTAAVDSKVVTDALYLLLLPLIADFLPKQPALVCLVGPCPWKSKSPVLIRLALLLLHLH